MGFELHDRAVDWPTGSPSARSCGSVRSRAPATAVPELVTWAPAARRWTRVLVALERRLRWAARAQPAARAGLEAVRARAERGAPERAAATLAPEQAGATLAPEQAAGRAVLVGSRLLRAPAPRSRRSMLPPVTPRRDVATATIRSASAAPSPNVTRPIGGDGGRWPRARANSTPVARARPAADAMPARRRGSAVSTRTARRARDASPVRTPARPAVAALLVEVSPRALPCGTARPRPSRARVARR